MKKPSLVKLFAAVMLICVALTTLAACEDVNVKVRFMVDDVEYALVEVNGQNRAEMPEDPKKEDCVFDGWYLDKDSWNQPFKGDVPEGAEIVLEVYAKWSDTPCTHTWSPWVTALKPTCSLEGKQVRYCIRCGKTEAKDIDKSEHTEEIIPAVAATCLSTGLTEGVKCSVCGEVLIAPTVEQPSDHDWERTTLERADCKNGGKEKCVCKTCNTIEFSEVAPLGHELIYTISGSADGGDLSVSYECARCSYDGICDNVTNADVTIKPTCAEYGQATLTYSDGTSKVVCLAKDFTYHVLKGKEVNRNETIIVDYDYENYKDVLTLLYGKEKITCKDGDYDECVFKCERCMSRWTITARGKHEIPADFDYNNEDNYKAPTSAENGFIKYTCVTCAENVTEELAPCEHCLVYTINKNSENSDLSVTFKCLNRACVYSGTCDNVISAEINESTSCAEYGSATLTYSNGTTEVVKLPKNKNRHLFKDIKITNGQQLDYWEYKHYIGFPDDTPGIYCGNSYEGTVRCENCNERVSISAIAKGKHELIYTISGSTDSGDLSASFKCSRCSYNGTCDNVTNADVTKKSTCAEYGSATLTYSDGTSEVVCLAKNCSNGLHCLKGNEVDFYKVINYSDYADCIALLEGVTKPDCRNISRGNVKCEACGDSYPVEVIGAHVKPSDIDYTDENNYKAPTSTESGYIKYNCSVCKEIITEEIPVHTHIKPTNIDYTDENNYKAPTPTESGYIKYNCSVHGELIIEEIPPHTHSISCKSVKMYDGSRYLVATCTDDDCSLNAKIEDIIENKTSNLYKNCVIDISDVIFVQNDQVTINHEQAALKCLTVKDLSYNCYEITISIDSVLQYLYVSEPVTITIRFSE